jgi:hypothetical protein
LHQFASHFFSVEFEFISFPLIIALSLTVWSNAEPKFDKVREGLMHPAMLYTLVKKVVMLAKCDVALDF